MFLDVRGFIYNKSAQLNKALVKDHILPICNYYSLTALKVNTQDDQKQIMKYDILFN